MAHGNEETTLKDSEQQKRVVRKKSSKRGSQENQANSLLKRFLDEREGCALQAWFRHFDKDQNGRIDFQEFQAGMYALSYPGNIQGLWEEMDEDNSGELTFEEVDAQEALIWVLFKRWCGRSFQGPRDMIVKLKHLFAKYNLQQVSNEEVLRLPEFLHGLDVFGWEHGCEKLIFVALDIDSEDCITARGLRWLEAEVRRYKQAQAAKSRATRVANHKAHTRHASQLALNDFKMFMRKQFGSLFRAWRKALDADGSMMVQRAELFKACRQFSWKGDVHALWQALDHDKSGVTTIEELDPQSAQLLAQFKEWAVTHWGLKPASAMFNALDRKHRRKLSYAQFVEECEALGFQHSRRAKNLAVWLDWRDKKYLQEEDFSLFDVWRPPPWLNKAANCQAAEDIKRRLCQRYRTLVKGWRSVLDKDNSNTCTWHEFNDAADTLKFTGDVAGAWMALDKELTGCITFKEIDEEVYEALVEFKKWAEDEFGTVKTAFKTMDADHTGSLNYKEFRFAARSFGFPGDVQAIFDNLDHTGENTIHAKEVVFLDTWLLLSDVPSDHVEVAESAPSVVQQSQQEEDKRMLWYYTKAPGPGTYEVPSVFGAMDTMPTSRYSGAFSFAERSTIRIQRSIGPAKYSPCLAPTKQRKPAWTFGGHPPLRSSTPRPDSRPSSRAERIESPGPGAYELGSTLRGPQFSIRPRRGLGLHPSQRCTPNRYIQCKPSAQAS